MHKSHRATALAISAVLLAGAAMAQQTEHGGRPVTVEMNGASEVPKTGDPDGTGTAKLTFNPGQEQICYELLVQGIATANAAHIHTGEAGKSGGVKVPLEAPKADGKSKACATVDRETLKQIMDNPSQYYVNVHNAEWLSGAVRGQLSK